MTVIVVVIMATATTAFVVVIVCLVDVTVCDLIFSRFAQCNHFAFECQRMASQHVVTINHHFVAVDFCDFNWDWTLVSVCQETHAHFDLIYALENVSWYALNQRIAVLAVCVFRCDSRSEFVTSNFAFQFTLKTNDQVVVTMQVIQWCFHC